MRVRATVATTAWRPWGATLLAVAGTLLVFALPGAHTLLQYDRVLVAQGEWWRLLTSHWVHWTGNHLFWDLLAFAALSLAALRIARARACGTLLGASVLIPGSIWLFHPGMVYYRGLSGLASALYVFVAMELLARARSDRDRFTALALWGLLVAFAAKVAYEVLTGDTLFAQPMGANVSGVPLAHLVGGTVGAVFSVAGRRAQSAARGGERGRGRWSQRWAGANGHQDAHESSASFCSLPPMPRSPT